MSEVFDNAGGHSDSAERARAALARQDELLFVRRTGKVGNVVGDRNAARLENVLP